MVDKVDQVSPRQTKLFARELFSKSFLNYVLAMQDFANDLTKQPGFWFSFTIGAIFFFALSLGGLAGLPNGQTLIYTELAIYGSAFFLIPAAALSVAKWSQPEVFVSYHIEDFTFATMIKDALIRDGLVAYVDPPESRDLAIKPHDDINTRIQGRLKGAD